MPDDTEYVLNYINELRRDYILGPPLTRVPKGYCNDSGHCPIARGLDPARVLVERAGVYFADLNEVAEFPSRITNFVLDFDRGEYPDLMVKGVL